MHSHERKEEVRRLCFCPCCLSVCQTVSPLGYSKSYEWTLMEFLEERGIDFGGDPDRRPDPRSSGSKNF